MVVGSGPEASLAAEGAKAATKPTAPTAGASAATASAAADAEGASAAQGKTYELELADPSVPLPWVGEVDGEEVSGEGLASIRRGLCLKPALASASGM